MKVIENTSKMEHNHLNQRQKTEKPIAIAEDPPIRENWTLRILTKLAIVRNDRSATDTKPESKELSDMIRHLQIQISVTVDEVALESRSLRTAAGGWDEPQESRSNLG